MKTIKELFEVYKPKSPDEQKFVDKHVAIKHKDRNGNDDDVFNATNVKAIKRKEERHGYDSGEDEKVYEDLEISDEELVFELSEDVEELEEGTVGYKNYTITARANKSGQRELGDIKHVYGHEKKMNKLGVKQNDDDKYGDTHHVTVKNNETGDVTHHHVYQSYGKDSTGKPTLSIRGVGKPHEQHSKHANVIAHYLSGKTKIKEDTDLAFFEDLLEMNLDEDTFTDASLAQLRVMKHKQEMKKIESSSKLHPLMKVRKLSDAKKKLADLEAARDHYVAKHEKAQAKKKKVAEEVDQIDELSVDTLDSYRSKARKEIIDADANDDTRLYNKRAKGYRAASKSVNKKFAKEEAELEEKTLTPAEMKKREEVVKAIKRENPGMDKSMAYAIATKTAKRVAEEVEELDELSQDTVKSYANRAFDQSNNILKMRHKDLPKSATKAAEQAKERRRKGIVAAGKRLGKDTMMDIASKSAKRVAEEVEDLDEGLMHDRYLRSHGKKARGTGSWAFTTKQYGSPKENEMHFTSGQKSLSDAHKEAAAKLGTKHLYVMEEVEDIDESAKIADHLIKRYGDNVRKSHVRSAANDFGVGFVALSHAVRKKLGVNRLEEEQLDELSFKKLAAYTAKSADSVSGAPVRKQDNRIKGQSLADKKIRKMDGYSSTARVAATNGKLTKEDIINRAIENYMPEEYVAPSLDEQFIAKIDHLSEAHAVTLLALFDSLNEENKKTMLETVDTQEGINSLLDFAIKNRGE